MMKVIIAKDYEDGARKAADIIENNKVKIKTKISVDRNRHKC